MSLGMGNMGWYLMMCIIIPVRYLAPRSFMVVGTEREECVKRKNEW
jgi:hypothetical protein